MIIGGRCYECFRPEETCFCQTVPSIDNRTHVLILQHRREYFHRFNTARIVHKALRNSELLVDRTDNLAKRLQVRPNAGLLYPGAEATLITEVPMDERPKQLVVVDGTWHHTKTLVRDIAALRDLPRFQLSPQAPSRYRIRREPDALALSTVEAAVEALRVLEPDTKGFDQLLEAFDRMVEDQLSHPGSATGARFKARRCRPGRHIPPALRGSLDQIVVVYGEAPAGIRGSKRSVGPPLTWLAQRLGDGARFACTIVPQHPLSDTFLRHLELTAADFNQAVSLDEARRRWAAFQRPDDLFAMLHPGTARLFAFLTEEPKRYLLLKSADLKSTDARGVASVPLQTAEQTAGVAACSRGSKRLAQAVELVRHLNTLAKATQVRGY